MLFNFKSSIFLFKDHRVIQLDFRRLENNNLVSSRVGNCLIFSWCIACKLQTRKTVIYQCTLDIRQNQKQLQKYCLLSLVKQKVLQVDLSSLDYLNNILFTIWFKRNLNLQIKMCKKFTILTDDHKLLGGLSPLPICAYANGILKV